MYFFKTVFIPFLQVQVMAEEKINKSLEAQIKLSSKLKAGEEEEQHEEEKHQEQKEDELEAPIKEDEKKEKTEKTKTKEKNVDKSIYVFACYMKTIAVKAPEKWQKYKNISLNLFDDNFKRTWLF